MTPVKIELTPYNAISILAFLREYINDDVKHEPQFKAISEAVDEYEKSIYRNMNMCQIVDAAAENQVNQLIGKSPIREKTE
jgi:hypothetical protein